MQIDRVDLTLIRLELVRPFETSRHRETHRPVVLVTAHGEGLTGWGECVAGAGPWYSGETIETAWHCLTEFLGPRLVAAPFEHPRDLTPRFEPVRGNPMAKAALEMAAWDLSARQQGASLAHALGGAHDRIESGISLGIEPSVQELLRVVAESVAAGYRRVKLKIKPGWDVAVVRAVREQFPDLKLTVDANGAYSPDDSDQLAALDDFGLLYIEQPFAPDALLAHARLQSQLRTAVCLDESITSPAAAGDALDLAACRIINIKPGRVGGFQPSVAIHDLAQQRGAPVWCGGMLETGIGRAHNVALASLPNFRLPHDLSASARYWRRDIIAPPFTLNDDGTLTVPAEPGLGVRVDTKRIKALAERRTTIGK